MYYVYFLSLNNGNIYTGSTNDLKRRVSEHKQGKVMSTKNKLPMIIAYEGYLLKSDAIRREKFLKTTEGKRLLKMQLKDCLEKFRARNSKL
ncbi:MAG: GIY-YIG nuclease family protein [Candidatus Staskawiczbacteria bacterium]|nr:GIY-YIG nuclease family protein [Candidatus Staskawiczbacteria bacterium]